MFILFLMRGVSTSKLNFAFLNCCFLLLIGAKNKSFSPSPWGIFTLLRQCTSHTWLKKQMPLIENGYSEWWFCLEKILVSPEIRTRDLLTESFIVMAALPSLWRLPFSTVAPKIRPSQVAITRIDHSRSLTSYPEQLILLLTFMNCPWHESLKVLSRKFRC